MAKRTIFRDITGVLSSNLVAMVSVLLINILLSRVLGPSGFGIYSSLFAVPLVVLSIAQLGMSRSAVYHLGRKLYNDSQTVSSILMILLITGGISILASAIAYKLMANPGFSLNWIIMILCGIPFFIGNVYLGGIFMGKEQIKQANIIFWLPVMLNLLLAVILVWFYKIGITGALISVLFGTLIAFTVSLLRLRHEFDIRLVYRAPIVKSLVSMGFVYAITTMLLKLNYKVDVLILQKMVTPAEVGFYSLGVSVTEQLWLLPYAMGVVLMTRTANANDQTVMLATTARLLRFSVLGAITGALAMALLAPPLLPLIFGIKYTPSIGIVQAILPGIVIFMIFRIIESHFAGIGKPWLSVWFLLPSLLVNIGLNFLWIPHYGAMGSAWATNVSYILATVLCVITFKRLTGLKFTEMFILQKADILLAKNHLRNRVKKDGSAPSSAID